MTECRWLSDRIPEAALGRSEWTPQDIQHLSDCDNCRQEWELVRAAIRMGRQGEDKVDVDTMASSLLQRLGHAGEMDRLPRRIWSIAALGTAAAVVLAVWTGGVNRTPAPAANTGSLAAVQLMIPLPELESLQPAELDSVLQTMDDANGRSSSMEEPDLGDLTAEELERVLDSWEG